MSNNLSGIEPVGISILVDPDIVEQTTASGIVTSTSTENEREQLRQTDGVVIAISVGAFEDEPTRCKVGDRVIMAALAGMIRKGVDGKNYRLIRDVDVVAILKEK